MKASTIKCALVATIALGAGVSLAQEMGATVAAEQGSMATDSDGVAQPPLSGGTETIKELVNQDDGLKIVEKTQKTAPAEVSPKNANDAMVKWVADNRYIEGFCEERGYILQIGVARDNSFDPLDEDFMTKREMLYREAQLRAKVEIAGIVERAARGSNYKVGLKENDIKAFEAKYAREINEMNEMKRKVAKLMSALDTAETKCLQGVTATDRLNALVDRVIKKLDRAYDAGQIAAEKKSRYEALKRDYEAAKAAADELEQKKIDMFPSQTVNAKIDTSVRIKLHGAIPLHQIESYVGKEFQVAVAVIWSPKLEERASLMLARKPVPAGNPTEDRTLTEYLAANKNALCSMVGARQFIDKNGRLYFFGVSAQEIPEDAVEKDENITFANQMAMQAVIMSLFVEGSGVSRAAATLAKRKGRSGDAMKSLAENMDEETPDDLTVSGLGKVYSVESVYPITQKPIYISVAAIDAALAAKAPAIQKAWNIKASDTVRTLHGIAGERQGAEDAYQAAKSSRKEYEAGRNKARVEIEDGVKKIRSATGGVEVTPAAATGTKTNPVKARQGIFSGNASHSDDF